MFWTVYEIIWVIGLLYSTNVTLISGLHNTIELVNQDIVLEIVIVVFLYNSVLSLGEVAYKVD